MQRTPIKLNIISISDRARELIGYIVLDLRAAGKFLALINVVIGYLGIRILSWKKELIWKHRHCLGNITINLESTESGKVKS